MGLPAKTRFNVVATIEYSYINADNQPITHTGYYSYFIFNI